MRLFVVRRALVVVVVLLASPAFAQDELRSVSPVEIVPLAVQPSLFEPSLAEPPLPPPAFAQSAHHRHRRPGAIVPLYISLGLLNGLDVHSTLQRISSNTGREANPVMRPVVKNEAAFVAVKAALTGAAIWTTEKSWKKHRKAAVVTLIVSNAVLAAVVANNYGGMR